MNIFPLVWLLVFDVVVGLIWWGFGALGVTFHPRLNQVMIGLVIVINLVVVVAWLLALVGWSPGNLAGGPFSHR